MERVNEGPITAFAADGEFADIELLHSISVALIGEHEIQSLYNKILDAAVAIAASQFGSMQVLHPERGRPGGPGELRLLTARGYSADTIDQFQWVRADSKTSCGVSLRTGRRTVIADVEQCELLAGSDELAAFLQAGIRSMQTTRLVSRTGELLGMITTHWSQPHEPSKRDLILMDILARQAADLLERTGAETTLRTSEDRFRTMADNISQLAWTCERLGEATWYNKRWHDYTGLSFEQMKDWGWTQVQHPDHAERVAAGVTQARDGGECWEDTFPLRGKDGEYRWFLSRAVPIRNGNGEIVQWFGTNTDITERRRAEELQKLLTGELSHRVKNMLATVQAIATQTLRHSKSPGDFVASFGGRIQSMSRVHSQLSSNEWQGTQLRDIVQDQMKLGPVDETRIAVSGPDVRLDAETVPKMAMMMHELGTNSLKYGALSRAAGAVTIAWAVCDNTLRVSWTERGGPTVEAPIRRGFGTALIERSAIGAGGQARMSLEADGVQWDITLPLPQVSPAVGVAAGASSGDRADRSPQSLHTADKRLAKALQGRRILVIEDEPLVAMDIADHLAESGADIVGPAGNAADALSLIEREHVDAALLDANLAGQPVDTVAAALTRKNVPFAFVSGYGRESLPQSFACAEALSKPFSAQQLVDLAGRLTHERANTLRQKPRQRTS